MFLVYSNMSSYILFLPFYLRTDHTWAHTVSFPPCMGLFATLFADTILKTVLQQSNPEHLTSTTAQANYLRIYSMLPQENHPFLACV